MSQNKHLIHFISLVHTWTLVNIEIFGRCEEDMIRVIPASAPVCMLQILGDCRFTACSHTLEILWVSLASSGAAWVWGYRLFYTPRVIHGVIQRAPWVLFVSECITPRRKWGKVYTFKHRRVQAAPLHALTVGHLLNYLPLQIFHSIISTIQSIHTLHIIFILFPSTPMFSFLESSSRDRGSHQHTQVTPHISWVGPNFDKNKTLFIWIKYMLSLFLK